MAFKRQELTKHIIDNLSFLSKSTHLKSIIGLFDDARGAQDFFAGLFNLMYDYELVELDKLHDTTTYIAVDLGDPKKKIAIQVTVQNDSFKINQTIKKFNKEKLYKEYDRLIICIIGKKLAYTSAFDTEDKFIFDKDKDIWDDDFIIKQIDKIADTQKLEAIKNFIQESLVEYKLPDHMYDDDIKKAIIALKTNIPDILKEDLEPAPIPNRTDDFMDKKNTLNNVSATFFKNIQGHLIHNETIVEFLKNPINKELQNDYFLVTGSIQNHYEENKDTYSSLEDLFRAIFAKLPRDYDNHVDENKVKIVLHNMYFTCDVGTNPQ